ncbi:alpha/beta fold hydrolase [Caulobacter sp. S45]|uniref:alpha/beta fold hydrolase n=1 Tax=Caulobacter sp. S45 TaxID=1641861 RepID=UPI0015761350|nr:alpha/beta hydrolase [Caulobacter sp. S45]
MSDPVLDLDRRLRTPLAAFQGDRPPAPEWFDAAIAHQPERSVTSVEGAEIEILTWGERGQPGLLFLHGGMASADWFDHIAPFFAETHRVAALSMSGAGRSSWREHYDVAQFAREMAAVAMAAGLHEAGPPVFVAHSFGSRPLLNAAANPELKLRAAVVLDAAISLPKAQSTSTLDTRPHRTYATFDEALSRFRLMPYQTCDNLYVVDHIGRQSLKRIKTADSPERWTWRSDPYVFQKLSGSAQEDAETAARSARCRLAFLYGDRSAIVRPDNLAHTREVAPDSSLFASIPDAAHHVFLDQPLATVAALRVLLAML